MIKEDFQRRFGDRVKVIYHNATIADVRAAHAETILRIERECMLYPVTWIDDTPITDGAVSYPTIVRAVQQKLSEVDTKR